MKKYLIRCAILLLVFSLLCPMVMADTTDPVGTEPTGEQEVETRPHFILRPTHNELEGADGKLTISVYITKMEQLIAGGSFGLRYSSSLTGFTFTPKIAVYEPFEKTNKPYHFFHFMEKDDSSQIERTGIDAIGDTQVLLCEYTFDVPYADFQSDKITTATITQLTFDNIDETANMPDGVIKAAWDVDEDGVYCYQGVYFDNEMETTFPIYFVNELPKADGVTVTGYVKSYDPKKPVTVQLIGSDNTYQTVIEALPVGKGLVTQAFEIENVTPGTYTLKITKPSHLPFTKQTVTVTEPDGGGMFQISGLKTGEADDTSDTAELLCGDIDADKFIKISDRNRLLSVEFYGKTVASLDEESQEAAKLCDLDGDGYVKKSDLNILMSGKNFGKQEVVIP